MMLEFIMKRLVNAIETQNADWRLQEALIYMLQSVVSELNESCSPDFNNTNDPFLISFIEILPKINYSNKHILSTTLLAVGNFFDKFLEISVLLWLRNVFAVLFI